MTWTEADHARLATLFDGVLSVAQNPGPLWIKSDALPPYAGYRPTVSEAPNGDTRVCPACNGSECAAHNQWKWTESGHKVCVPGDPGCGDDCPACKGTGRVPNVDAGRAGKRFLHVAQKYNPPAWAVEYLARAHWEACKVATALGVPSAYRPHESDGTLRVLEYPSAGHPTQPDLNGDEWCPLCNETRPGMTPDLLSAEVCPALAPGAGTAEHTDSNLFTIVLWRSHPADLECDYFPSDAGPGEPSPRDWAEAVSPGLHIGEIGALVGLGPATPHRVPARPYVQKSIVYFAVPDHAERLPKRVVGVSRYANGDLAGVSTEGGETVGEYLDEWKKRARVY